MSRGGARKGAGRKRGSTTRLTREVAERASAEGITPLEYMLAVMRDESAEAPRRDDMAKASAPYMHPRLASTEHKGEGGGPIVHRVEWSIVDPKAAGS